MAERAELETTMMMTFLHQSNYPACLLLIRTSSWKHHGVADHNRVTMSICTFITWRIFARFMFSSEHEQQNGGIAEWRELQRLGLVRECYG